MACSLDPAVGVARPRGGAEGDRGDLDREGFRPPKRATGFTAGMVRRLLHEMGLRARPARVVRRGRSFVDKPSLAAATCHFLCHPEKSVEFLSTPI